jgi:hypothetical protein
LLFGCHIVTIKIRFPDNSASKEDSTPQGFLPPTPDELPLERRP